MATVEENEPIRESANEERDENFIWLANKKAGTIVS